MKMERLSGITLLEADGANQSEEGAKMNNEFLPAYKVYQQVIDLELYYAFVDLVVHTSQEEKAWEIYRNIVDTQNLATKGRRTELF